VSQASGYQISRVLPFSCPSDWRLHLSVVYFFGWWRFHDAWVAKGSLCPPDAVLLLPAVPLAVGWTETVRSKPKGGLVMVMLLLLVSGSFASTIVGLFSPLALGRFHSGTRQAIISGNVALMILVAVVAYARKRDSWATILAAGTAALVWYYIAIVNIPV
jgi:hypothetical protein